MTRGWTILVTSFLAATVGALFVPPSGAALLGLGVFAAGSFAVAIAALFRTGRLSWLLVALTAMQLVLFARIHWMIYCVLGPQHYICSAEPQWYHWLQLIGAHVARAADVLDVIEECSINLQAVRNAGALAGAILVVMHVMVDIFVLGALVQAIRRALLRMADPAAVRGGGPGRSLSRAGRVLKTARWPALAVIVLFTVAAARAGQWSLWNCLFWPLDNLIRAVDIGDAMQIFSVHLHTVEAGAGAVALAICFRLVVGLCLAEVLSLAALRALRGRGKTSDELRDILASSRVPSHREIAVQALGRMGPHAAEAVPDLVRALTDSRQWVRETACRNLGRIDPKWPQSDGAQKALPDLVRSLADRDYQVRWAADMTLAAITREWPRSEGAREAVPDLVRALADRDPEVRRAAEVTVARIDWTWPQSDGARKAVPDLVRALADKETQVRQAAEAALARIDWQWPQSDGAQEALPDLVRALADGQSAVRAAAAETVARVGPHAVPHLVRALAHSDSHVRAAAADALGKTEPQWPHGYGAQTALPDLVRALALGGWQVRRAAAEAVARIGPMAVPAIVRALADGDWRVRRAAADALGKLGPASAPAVPDLVRALADSQLEVSAAVAKALDKIDPRWRHGDGTQKALPDLIGWLAHSDAGVRRAAAEALGKLGPVAATAVSHFARALADGEWQVCRAAACALGEIGPAAAAAVPDLGRAVAHWHSQVREAAARVLGSLGPAAAAAAPRCRTWDGRCSAMLCSFSAAWGCSRGTIQTPRVTRIAASRRIRAIWASFGVGPFASILIPLRAQCKCRCAAAKAALRGNLCQV